MTDTERESEIRESLACCHDIDWEQGDFLLELLDKERAASKVLREALKSEPPTEIDPKVADLIAEAGRRGAYGTLMSSAELAWKRSLESKGYPSGGEFVCGQCRVTVENALIKADAILEGKTVEGWK